MKARPPTTGASMSEHSESYGKRESLPLMETKQADDASSQYTGGKWGQYLRAPDSWFDLLERARSRMAPLRELARVRFGFKTGADRFFCVRDVTQQYLGRHRGPTGVPGPLGNIAR